VEEIVGGGRPYLLVRVSRREIMLVPGAVINEMVPANTYERICLPVLTLPVRIEQRTYASRQRQYTKAVYWSLISRVYWIKLPVVSFRHYKRYQQ
jgi:hypothetical protein